MKVYKRILSIVMALVITFAMIPISASADSAQEIQITDGETYTGYIGTTHQLNVAFLPEGADQEWLYWESSDANTVEVDSETGDLSLRKVGTAVITATSSDTHLTDSITVEVMDCPSIVMDQETVIYATPESAESVFSFVPETSGVYIFHSYNNQHDTYAYLYDSAMNYLYEDDDGAEFDNNFKLSYELTAGEKYYFKSKFCDSENVGTYSVELNMCPPATSMEITNAEDTLCYVGFSNYFDVVFSPENAAGEEVIWTVDDPEAATINGNNIIFHKVGEFIVTATSESNFVDSCTVTVAEPAVLTKDQPVRFTACNDTKYIKFEPTESEPLRIDVNNPTNAENLGMVLFDSSGQMLDESVYALEHEFEAGETYYIRIAVYSEESGEYIVSLMELVPAISMSIDKGDAYTAYLGSEVYLNAIFAPDNAMSEEVSWESNNPEVAYVDEYGCVMLIKKGVATITATSENNLVATCEITIEEYSTIALDQSETVELNMDKPDAYFYFTPEEDGYYVFYSNSEYDPRGYIFDTEFNELSSNDDVGENHDFRVGYFMDAGTTYILKTEFNDSSVSGSFDVAVEKAKYITNLEILSPPDKMEYVEGQLDNYLTYDGLALRATWSDNSTTDWEYGQGNYIEDQPVFLNVDEDGLVNISCGGQEASFTFTLVENPVESIELVSGSITLVEEVGGHEENGVYYYDFFMPSDVTIRIHYTDTSSKTVNVHDNVDGYRFSWYFDQYEHPWVLDGEQYVTIEYLGANIELPVTIIENPVDHIELVSGTSYFYMENSNGYIEPEADEPFFYYYCGSHNHSDAVIRIVYNDGRLAVEANVGDEVDGFTVNWQDNQYDHPWGVGDNNQSAIEYLGYTVNLPITVKGNSVESIELVSGSITLVENAGGYEEDGIYYYDFSMPSDVTVKIHYTDAPSKTVNVYDNVDGYWFDWYSDQYEQRWVLGGEQYATIEFLGAKTQIPVSIIENPVDHIELLSGTSKTYIENSNGRIDGQWGEPYFYYYCDESDHRDALIKIVYKGRRAVYAKIGQKINGYLVSWEDNQYETPWVLGEENQSTIEYLGHTVNLPITVEKSKVVGLEVVSGGSITFIENAYGYEEDGIFYYSYELPSDLMVKILYSNDDSKIVNVHETVDGYSFNWDSKQQEKPWVLGDDNHLTLSYLGAEVEVPVSIVETPVDYIEINSAPTREYFYGDETYGYNYENGDYEFYPSDMKGLSFTVYYKDESAKTFTYEDIDEDGYINGYGYNAYCADWYPEIGDVVVTFEYMGKSADYEVVLKDTTVESISVTKLPDNPIYSDYQFFPDLTGMEITITYSDQTNKVVTLTEENANYQHHSLSGETICRVEVDNDELSIYKTEHGLSVFYMGISEKISGIAFEAKPIASITLGDVSANGDGMSLDIVYTDKTHLSLALELVDFHEFGVSNCSANGKTEKGYLDYMINTYKDEEGNEEYYTVFILGEEINIDANPAIIGDANRNGEMDVLDATILRRYLVGGWDETIDPLATDMNKDGVISLKDFTLLCRALVNWGS